MPLFNEKVFFGNPVDQFRSHRAEILSAVEQVCDQGPHILGPLVDTFETEFAAWNGCASAAGVGSGTDALVLAMLALGIGPGDEIVTVAHTALATVSAIVLTGARPVLVDVDAATATLDVTKLEAAITPKTKAIIPVHLYGFTCALDEILEIAKRHSIPVIEDCAQAHGAIYKGKKVGTLGVAGCFSFYPTKNLGAIGDGGAVISNDTALTDKIKQLRQYGWDAHRVAQAPGMLSRLDPLQAAVLSIKLKTLSASLDQRRAIAAAYDAALDWSKYQRPQAQPETNPAYHLYVVAHPERDRIIARLKEQNVEAGIHYAVPAHLHPGYSNLVTLPPGGLTVTERLSNSVLSLPIYPEFPTASAKKIAEFMNDL